MTGTPTRIRSELKTLLWLQRRLTISSFRSGQKQDVLRILGYVLLGLMLVPAVIIFNAVLVWIYRSLDAGPAAEVATIMMSFIVMSWLLTPASNTQMVEPFSIPKLFAYPISLNGLVLGSLVVNIFSVGFLVTLPFILAVIAGMARNIGAVVPTLITGSLFLAALLVLKALIDDVFDLIAEDRRLRAIGILVALLPVVAIVGAQFYFQSRIMLPAAGDAESFGDVVNFSVDNINTFITDLQLSRFLVWQPGGWVGRAVGAAAVGRFDQWAAWTLALAAFVVLGYIGHRALLSRLYFGELVHVQARGQAGAARLRSAGPRLPFVSAESSQALWAFLDADWRGFKRNPYTIRMAVGPVILALMAIFFGATLPGPPAGVGALLGFTAVLTVTLSYGHNVFGVLDNPGFGTALLAPVRLRWLLVSHNLLLTVLVAAMALGAGLLVALIKRDPWPPLAAVGAALFVQFIVLTVCNFTAVLLPYKIDLEKGRAASNEARTSVFSMFAVLGGMGLLMLPVILAAVSSGLLLDTIVPGGVVALVYAVTVYVSTTALAGRLLESQAQRVLAEITQGP